MGLFKQAEFAKKCGIHQAYLTVTRIRSQVIVNKKGMVDDTNPINALFMEKCLRRVKKEPKEVENAVAPPDGDKVVKAITPKRSSAKKPKTEVYDGSRIDERFDLETAKKKQEILKLERETQLADIKHEKWIGKLTPTDVTKSLFIQTIKNYTVSFKQAADKVVQDFAKRTRMNRNEIAAMKGVLILAINHATENAVMESQKGVGNIVREYAEAKDL